METKNNDELARNRVTQLKKVFRNWQNIADRRLRLTFVKEGEEFTKDYRDRRYFINMILIDSNSQGDLDYRSHA